MSNKLCTLRISQYVSLTSGGKEVVKFSSKGAVKTLNMKLFCLTAVVSSTFIPNFLGDGVIVNDSISYEKTLVSQVLILMLIFLQGGSGGNTRRTRIQKQL